MNENEKTRIDRTKIKVNVEPLVSPPTIFIDGDFKTGMGNCKYHCSPTCHPGQVGPDKWHYGCLHKAFPSNRYGDFCPFVECEGDKNKCELKGKKFIGRYRGGLKRKLNNALAKVKIYEEMLAELNELAD